VTFGLHSNLLESAWFFLVASLRSCVRLKVCAC